MCIRTKLNLRDGVSGMPAALLFLFCITIQSLLTSLRVFKFVSSYTLVKCFKAQIENEKNQNGTFLSLELKINLII